MNKRAIIAGLVLFFCWVLGAAAWTPTPAEMEIIQRKISPQMRLIKELLPQQYFDFVTREAIACTMSKMTDEALGENCIGIYRGSLFSWRVSLGEISTFDAVNVENLVHELAHAGADGLGNDNKKYDKRKEVNARKREAENWKAAADKPPRETQDWLTQQCWATYDIVFSAKGIQRTHDFIKTKMLGYGYTKNEL